MSDRELELNSLEQFRKRSSRLVLEEYSHCEVPAGCGGVVLRWRDPNDGLPLSLRVYTPGPRSVLLNGSAPTSSRPVLPYGEYVLGLVLAEIDPEFMALAFAAAYEPKGPRGAAVEAPVTLLTSRADGSWRYRLTEPPDGWLLPDYEDHSWEPMLPNESVRPFVGKGWDAAGYHRKKAQELGAEGLGVRELGGRVWVRRRFQLTPGPSMVPPGIDEQP